MIATITVAACGSHTRQIDVALLASDRSVHVGGETLTLPYVALSDFVYAPISFSLRAPSGDERAQARRQRETFLARAAQRETAPTLESITVSIAVYASYGELGQSARICPRLKRRWAISICGDSYSPIYQALPHEFELVEFGKFEKYKHHFFAAVRGKTRYDQVSALRFRDNVSSVSCFSYDVSGHRPGQTCLAGRLVGNRLVALWEAWERKDGHEKMQERADREGRMIAEFVEKGLGGDEDFQRLERAAVELRSPDAPTWSPGRVYSPESMNRVVRYGLKMPQTFPR
ncbi:MAG: hypothetical protein K2W81_12420 [Sphingomonas sp.]|uniref:hypothetical protein n=1 Tax=Sphingomonas sp. TaxID=28214 RepID=UPI0025EAF49E|nr:hypothetical protein [Sphingomonas sp.]MBY0284752.1 hypothetical protein [Sphingomonas sp.]